MFTSNLAEISSFDNAYFIKYGRGGVIVILESSDLKSEAEHFHRKDDINSALGFSCLQPIKNIEIKGDELSVHFSLNGNALVSRTLDKSQITIEVFKQQEA